MKLKELIQSTIRPHKGTPLYQPQDEVYNETTKETGIVQEVIHPSVFSRNKNIQYRISWIHRTDHGCSTLQSEVIQASNNISKLDS